MIFYESPHRIVKTLEQLAAVLGPERPASVSRELTKLFEETITAPLAELAANFAARAAIKGEIVLVVQGREKEERIKQNRYANSDDDE